jgi:hypothetical protein
MEMVKACFVEPFDLGNFERGLGILMLGAREWFRRFELVFIGCHEVGDASIPP